MTGGHPLSIKYLKNVPKPECSNQSEGRIKVLHRLHLKMVKGRDETVLMTDVTYILSKLSDFRTDKAIIFIFERENGLV